MNKNALIADLNLTDEQKDVVSSIINRYGSGQHPVSSVKTVDHFYLSYFIHCTNKEDFQTAINDLTPKGLKIWESIEAILEEIQ
jgi:hypothetical protein